MKAVNLLLHRKNLCVPLTVLLMLLLMWPPQKLHAQEITINGFVYDSVLREPVRNVKVQNLTTNKKTMGRADGKFSMTGKVGDLLYFTANAYRFDTLRINSVMKDTVYVCMEQAANMLPSVQVSTLGYTKYQRDSVQRRMSFDSALGSPPKKSVSKANSQGAGFGIDLDRLFDNTEKKKKKAVKVFNEQEESAYVRYRFSRDMVTSYTGLKDKDLEDFMLQYTPGYEWLRSHTSEEDIFYYINDSLKSFYRKKEEK